MAYTEPKNGGLDRAVIDIVKAQKIPLLIHNAGADDLTQRQSNPYIFRSSFSNSQYTHPLGDWAYKKGFRKASLLASDYAAGHEATGGFARVFTQLGGTVIQEQYPALGTPDPAPFVTSIKPDADIVMLFFSGPDAIRTVQALNQYGVKKRTQIVATLGLTEDGSLSEQKDNALGIITSGYWSSALDTPGNKAFMSLLKPRLVDGIVGLGAEGGYTGAMVLEKALVATNGDVQNRDAFLKALAKVEISDTPRGPIKFDSYNNPVFSNYIMEVKNVNGQLVNAPIERYTNVSQFWNWSPEEFLKMKPYSDLKGTWAK